MKAQTFSLARLVFPRCEPEGTWGQETQSGFYFLSEKKKIQHLYLKTKGHRAQGTGWGAQKRQQASAEAAWGQAPAGWSAADGLLLPTGHKLCWTHLLAPKPVKSHLWSQEGQKASKYWPLT